MVILDKHGKRKKRVVRESEKYIAELDLVIARDDYNGHIYLHGRDANEEIAPKAFFDVERYTRIW